MDGYAWIDEARDGESNMVLDRRLLEAAERRQCALLRLYRWREATLSLGHFQASADRSVHRPSAELPVVLRSSGGGAIVHHHEWTYAIALPVGKNRIGAATHLYDLVHDALVTGLRSLGWDARKWDGCQPAGGKGADAPFLCFQRRSCGDIVCGDAKVVGSAQRRFGSSVLQHGSLLCSTSPFAPELPGLAELARGAASQASSEALRATELEQSGTDFARRLAGSRNRSSTNDSSASARQVGLAGHRQFSTKSELESGNFGYTVLSWVVAPLLKSLGVSWKETTAPPEWDELWNCPAGD